MGLAKVAVQWLIDFLSHFLLKLCKAILGQDNRYSPYLN
jgi:hypothetical protein